MCNSGRWRIPLNMKARETTCWSPAGAADNSPALERWVGRQKVASPEGTTEVQSRTPSFCRPFGTCVPCGMYPGVKYVFTAMVGMARCAVPARVVAGGTNIRATLALEEVAPLHAARTSQRDVPTTLNTNGVKTPYLFSASQRRGVGTDAAVSQSRQRLECGDLSPLSSASASQ